MEKLYKIIVENTANGAIDKKVAVELLKTIKTGDIRQKDDIAIIGMAVRFPMAANISEFWCNIAGKADCASRIPDNRKSDLIDYMMHKNIDTRTAEFDEMGYLHDIDKFDYHYFNISFKEACLMDPNQRIFLETAMEAIEDGGYGGGRLRGTRTGVYVGSSNDLERTNYMEMVMNTEASRFSIAVPGNIRSIVAGRVSYMLDLKGPAVVINTACSSSLVALYYACLGLKNGECNMAIAGGIRILFMPLNDKYKLGIESSSQRARTFDNFADGTISGEGAGAVLLKPLKKAIEDGDNIYAVIKGAAINQDGSSNGITAPKPEAQEDVIIRAWKDAGIDPRTIRYIEAHGTGTKLGDPIEIDGIQRAFRKYTSDRQFCAISAVKSNMGHLDAAAGIAGLIKAVLALKHRKLPPMCHFNVPNRVIDFNNSPVYVNEKLRDWESANLPRRCGISSFGLTGTNCHVVIEEAPDTDSMSQSNTDGLQVLTISAKTQESLNTLIRRYSQFLENAVIPSVASFCYTSNTGRGHYNYRVIMILDKDEDIREKLKRVHTESTCSDVENGIFFGIRNDADETLRSINLQADEKVIRFVADGKRDRKILAEICRLYVNGADINWDNFYKGEKIRKMSIPTYPFAKKRCWIDVPKEKRETGFFTAVWEPGELRDNAQTVRHSNVLIFEDGKGLGRDIRSGYEAQGIHVTSISFGTEYVKKGADEYCIRNLQEDYTALLGEISLDEVSQIVHLSSVSNDSEVRSPDELDFALQSGVMSLFYLAKALAAGKLKNQIELVVVSSHVNDVTQNETPVHPEHSTMYGLGKVIGQENRSIRCRCVDIDEHTDGNELVRELLSSSQAYMTAYREGKRYVEGFTKIDIESRKGAGLSIKKNGVYIVTGGTGGIGLELSDRIASKVPVRLVFINRTPVPERSKWNELINDGRSKWSKKLKKIIKIEENGTKTFFYSADISDYGKMKEIIDDIRSKQGGINGIIHCAGVPGDGFLLRKDEDVFRSVLSPKVYGTWILDDLTKNDKIDFMIYCSSIASVFGGFGQGDYAAANSYLDAYSIYRTRSGRRTISINWPAWEETGMYAESTSKLKTVIQPLSVAKAVEVFDRITGGDLPRIIVGDVSGVNIPLNTFIATETLLGFNNDNESGMEQTGLIQEAEKELVMNVKLAGRKDGYSEMERIVGAIWCDILGLQEIHVDCDFFDLGGNSLIAINLVSDLNTRCNVSLTVTDVFDYPTVAKLAAHITATDQSHYMETGNAPANEYYPDPDDRIIDNVEPFGDFFYKSCLFNSLFPAIKHFNRSIIPILANDALAYTLNDVGRISSEYIPFTGLLDVISELGLSGTVSVIHEEINSHIKEAIDRGRVCIVWIDCFYVTERKDTYQKIHHPHTLLIYGYNDMKQVFYIIDHRLKESLMYGKYQIPYSELTDAYGGYLKNLRKDDETNPSYYELFEDRPFDEAVQQRKSIDIYRTNMLNKKKRILQGIEILDMISKEFILCDPVYGSTVKYLEECIAGFNEIINAKQVEMFKLAGLFGKETGIAGILDKIYSKWITARAKTAKLVFTESANAEKMLEIYNLLNEIVKLEVQYHNSLYSYLDGSDFNGSK